MQTNEENPNEENPNAEALETFYDRGGVLPGTPERPFSDTETAFLVSLAKVTPLAYVDIADLYRYVKSFDDTARICELALKNKVSLKELISQAKAGQAEPGPAAIQIEIKATENSINLEFNQRAQYLVFSLAGAKEFANQIIDAVNKTKAANRGKLYLPNNRIIK